MNKPLEQLKILALIPARAGFQEVPKKNIALLNNHPLIAYSIVAAKLSRYTNRIIVTTDSKEIANISKEYGAEVPFLRPKEISTNHSVDKEFFIHTLDWLKKNENYVPDLIIHLRPTTPARDFRIIDKAIEEFVKDTDATSLRSAHISEYTGYKLFKIDNNYCKFFGSEDFEEIEHQNLPRQKLPITYNPNGYVDILLPRNITSAGIHGLKIKPFITSRLSDIDTEKDFELAQKLIKKEEFKEITEYLDKIKENGKLS